MGRFRNTGKMGQVEGYRCVKLRTLYLLGCIPYKHIWRVTITPAPNSLSYEANNGVVYVPNYTFESDFGSIPFPISFFLSPEEFLGYLFHDSACRFGGLYSPEGIFIRLSRKQADALLYEMVGAEGAGRVKAALIYAGVRIGASVGIGVPDFAGDMKDKPLLNSRFHYLLAGREVTHNGLC